MRTPKYRRSLGFAASLAKNFERSDNFVYFFNFHRHLFRVLDALVVLDGGAVGVEDGGGGFNLRPHVVGHFVGVVAYVVREDDVIAALFQRALRDVEEPEFIGFRQLAITLGYVGRDADRCPLELRHQCELLVVGEHLLGLVEGQYELMRFLPSANFSE